MLTHGYNPDDFLLSNIISIPKNTKGSLSTSDNYRGISLCNALTKVLDLIIIEKYHSIINSSSLQYGFKEKHSTVMCTTVFKEIIQYYNDRGTDVYCCFLDATKAFDRIHFGTLFKLLISRKLPGVILRILFDLYNRQTVQANWQDTKSDAFNVLNGVRQGAILSPLLFCIYIDVLLARLKENGVGCHIGNLYYGALGYADDLVLLCPTRKGLQNMLDTCDIFGSEYCMSFNTTKTVGMIMSHTGSKDVIPLTLSGNELKWVNSFKYLGIHITPDLKDETDINIKKGQFNANVNYLLASFGKLQSNVLNQLFDTYCCSFYGCQSWSLECKMLHQLRTAYNKAIRRIWKLPYTAHTNVTLSIANKKDLINIVENRICSLYSSMCNSDNQYVSYIANVVSKCRTSRMSVNVDKICKNNGIFDRNFEKWHKEQNAQRITVDEYHTVTAQMTKELLLCRENVLHLNNFTVADIDNLTSWLTTM
jgi:hypothetical protein